MQTAVLYVGKANKQHTEWKCKLLILPTAPLFQRVLHAAGTLELNVSTSVVQQLKRSIWGTGIRLAVCSSCLFGVCECMSVCAWRCLPLGVRVNLHGIYARPAVALCYVNCFLLFLHCFSASFSFLVKPSCAVQPVSVGGLMGISYIWAKNICNAVYIFNACQCTNLCMHFVCVCVCVGDLVCCYTRDFLQCFLS